MTHYLTVPINENGIISDTVFQQDMTIVSSSDFNIGDLFVYSHGWWTSALSALSMYNRFTTEFADKVIRLSSLNPIPFVFPQRFAGIGLHWPSTLSENPSGVMNDFEAASYYTMEKRADTVGENALYSIVRMAIEGRKAGTQPLRIHFLGHSFGTKVVCSALQTIADNFSNAKASVEVNVVLIQPAFQDNSFEEEQEYCDVCSTELNARILITTSQLDKALGTQFPAAEKANIFQKDKIPVAMGFKGPTQATESLFQGCDRFAVQPGFKYSDYFRHNRLVVADITPLHQRDQRDNIYKGDDFGGFHSDIYIPELYELIASFLFPRAESID